MRLSMNDGRGFDVTAVTQGAGLTNIETGWTRWGGCRSNRLSALGPRSGHSPRLPPRDGRVECLRHPRSSDAPEGVDLTPAGQPNIDVHEDADTASTKRSRKQGEKIRTSNLGVNAVGARVGGRAWRRHLSADRSPALAWHLPGAGGGRWSTTRSMSP